MKVTDGMVEAALRASQFFTNTEIRKWMRAAIEAAIAAYVKPTRSESAKARWAKMTMKARHDQAKRMAKGRWSKKGLDARA